MFAQITELAHENETRGVIPEPGFVVHGITTFVKVTQLHSYQERDHSSGGGGYVWLAVV